MNIPAPSIAIGAKFFLRKSQSMDVLTEEGRQINNGYLNPRSAYQEDGAPRMGFSREPADFAFIAFVKTKTSSIDSTSGKNVLAAMSQAGSQVAGQARGKSQEGLVGNSESSYSPAKQVSRGGLVGNSSSSSNQARKNSREGLIGDSGTVARSPQKSVSNPMSSPSQTSTRIDRDFLVSGSDSSAKVSDIDRGDAIDRSPNASAKFVAAKTNTAVETYKGISVNITA